MTPAHLSQDWIRLHTPARQWRLAWRRYHLGRLLRRIVPYRHRCTSCPGANSAGGQVPPEQCLLLQVPTL